MTACAECGHDVVREGIGTRFLRVYVRPWLGLKAKGANCPERLEDESGWGTECGCPQFAHSTY